MSKIHFHIELGNRWRMFAVTRKKNMTFIGTVQHDVAAIGALAKTSKGRDVQVNGDVVDLLNTRKITLALRMLAAKTQETQETQCVTHLLDTHPVAAPPRRPEPVLKPSDSPPASASVPVVTVKKRRIAVRVKTTDISQVSEQAGVEALPVEQGPSRGFCD